MGYWCNDASMDAMLNHIKFSVTKLCLCSAQPATYAEATTQHDGSTGNYMLGVADITSADFTGPGNGVVSGRKITVGSVVDIPVLATGTLTHIALCDGANSTLIYVSECDEQLLTALNTVTTPSYNIEIEDPSVSA